jgi:hypothetical protein
LRLINFDLADIYFPLYIIQVNWDVFPLRNRKFKAAVTGKPEVAGMVDDLAIINHDMMRENYEQTCKIFFILRDQYLLTKVWITGTIVFYIKKDDKHFFGIDDSSGVITCVLWLNEFNSRNGGSK